MNLYLYLSLFVCLGDVSVSGGPWVRAAVSLLHVCHMCIHVCMCACLFVCVCVWVGGWLCTVWVWVWMWVCV